MKEHEGYMRLALFIARRYKGFTHPNPTVGCVVVNKGRIVGIGVHEGAGKPHAEVVALRMAGKRSKGADLYVTLEPCSHYGRTPPCTDAILNAGIKRVFIGVRDPNPLVDGVEYLISKGVDVRTGILENECFEINVDFFTSILKGRPYITLKIAQSVDGSIATVKGDSKWITSLESRRYVHRMRSYASAVLVGANTVINDDPLLTVRHIPSIKKPLRIVLDPSFKVNPDLKIFNTGGADILLVVSKTDAEKEEIFEKKGVEIIHIHKRGDFIDLEELCRILISRGIINVLVEGGAFVFKKFIEYNLFDKVVIFSSPKIIGGMHLIMDYIKSVNEAVNLKLQDYKRIKDDIVIELINKDHIQKQYLSC